MENWFGLTNGKYFGEPPLYVDKSKPAGMTDLPKPTVLTWIRNSPFILITSPNFVWACISLALYVFAPYDIRPESSAALAPISYTFIAQRFPIWFAVTFGYFSFWHIALYGLNMASRPFIENRPYNLDKLVHNAFWTSSGIMIWTVFENVICYLWATGRLAYVSDVISFTTFPGMFRFAIALMGVPVWRSVHFYFAHRFLHYRPLYQQVHSLHHRNTDIEPFSGLCMHPIEHIYYFACILPSLVFYCSPYAFMWNGVHLLLSPAASHSGYEDHFQSDVFHYLHHRYFECNYAGSDAAFMDIFFGTFKASFKDHPADKDGPTLRDDAKSTLRIMPSKEFVIYLSTSSLCILAWSYIALHSISVSSNHALALSSLVGFGPVILANIISSVFRNRSGTQSIRMSLAGNMFHLGFGTLFCSIPITYACYLTLMPPPISTT